jgi:hypothetical protein
MEIDENELEKARSGSPAQYFSNELIDLYVITYRLMAPKCDGTM